MHTSNTERHARLYLDLFGSRWFALAIIAMICCGSVAAVASGHTDTLSYYNTHDASVFYRDRGIQSQAARFDLAAPAYVRQVTLWLTGPGTGTALLTLYGNEGAFAAPLVGARLSSPIVVKKRRAGVQKVVVELPDDLFVERPQFFVVLSEMSEDIYWLSDRDEREPRCVSGADRWYYQAIQLSSGEWKSGKYAYAVEAIVDVPETYSPGYLVDVTADLGFPEEFVEKSASNQSIAWADLNSDGWFDLLVGGELFLNRRENGFEEATDNLNLSIEDPVRAHLFLDVDNDRDEDILWFVAGEEPRTLLLKNNGDGEFSSSVVDLPELAGVSTYSVADLDGDHDLDLFVGQDPDKVTHTPRSYLLINDGSGQFVPVPLVDKLLESDQDIAAYTISSAQWIDADADGDNDLSLSFASSSLVATPHILLLNDGDGNLARRTSSMAPSTTQSGDLSEQSNGLSGAPSDWGVVESTSRPQLLQPVGLSVEAVKSSGADRTAVAGGVDDPALNQIPFQSYAGAGLWGDVDNNGRLDALFTSACDCRFATLYLNERRGEVVDRSFDYGLFRIPAGSDAVWIDYNNDGLLDLATFVQGRFRLFENTMNPENSYVAIDLSGSGDGEVVGGSVSVHAGEMTWTRPLYSGRGSLMQGPPVLHFGLGGESAIDSIVYNSLSGEYRQVLQSPGTNALHRMFNGTSARGEERTLATMAASPNPFTSVLTFDYTVPRNMEVRIQIHAIDGTVVGVPVNDHRRAGVHTVEWHPLSPSGEQLPAGVYIWRATIGRQRLTGRVVLAK